MESVGLRPPRAPLKPLQSLVLRHSSNLQTSGLSFACLLLKLRLPPERLSHLARREAKVVKVRVAQRTLSPRLVPWPSLGLGKAVNVWGRRLPWLKSRAGTPCIKSTYAQHQTLVSAPGLVLLAKLKSTSVRKRRLLRRVLCLTKVRTRTVSTGGGPAVSQLPPQSDLPLDHWASHRPEDDTIPANAKHIEWAGGLVLFRGTRHFPLITFETELEARRQVGQQLRLWQTELIEHERQSLDVSRTVGGLVLPRPSDLPCLPPWAAPNEWDYWGHPWAYMDVPSGHREVGVSSTLTPPSSRVTVAVLMDCPYEPQLLPDMAVAQSASIAAGRATRQARPFTQKGEVQYNMKVEFTAKRLFPRGNGHGYSAAVLDQLQAWETFRTLNLG